MRRRAFNRSACARGGFTLLETLLAITLLSLIMGAILGGLHVGRRSWESGRLYEGVSEVEEAARAIADQLSRAYPAQTSGGQNNAVVAFEGQPDFCRIVALSEGGAQWGGLLTTEIGDDHAELGDISIFTRVFRADEWRSGRRRDAQSASVLRDVAFFKLSYFGEVERGRAPVWTDSWAGRAELPLLIAVKLGARRFGKVVEASFVTALRLR